MVERERTDVVLYTNRGLPRDRPIG